MCWYFDLSNKKSWQIATLERWFINRWRWIIFLSLFSDFMLWLIRFRKTCSFARKIQHRGTYIIDVSFGVSVAWSWNEVQHERKHTLNIRYKTFIRWSKSVHTLFIETNITVYVHVPMNLHFLYNSTALLRLLNYELEVALFCFCFHLWMKHARIVFTFLLERWLRKWHKKLITYATNYSCKISSTP